MAPVQTPNFLRLPTLDHTPSWLNAKGAIDRSACIEIRVSEIRRLAGCVKIDRTRRDSRRRHLHLTFPLPNEKPARKTFADGWQRLSTGVITITARHLHELHQRRMPRLLAGDFRTARANVMKEEVRGQTSDVSDVHSAACGFARSPQVSSPKPNAFRTRVTRAQPIAWPPDRGLPGNPNKGATRSKIIGLPTDWSQPIRIEKWLYPNRIRPVYFMICPGHDQGEFHDRGHRGHRVHRDGNKIKPQERAEGRHAKIRHCKNDECSSAHFHDSQPNSSSVSSAFSVLNPPPLSTRRPGWLDPSVKGPGGGAACPQRCLKLLMVQCTQAEARDADLAQLWIDSLPRGGRLRLREPYKSFINKLLTRYGLIMFPRVLLCPRCLKVHYGNNPETVRQGWRRRNKKPDTTVVGNAHRLAELTPLTHWSRYNLAFAEMAMQEGRTKRRNVETSKRRKKNGNETTDVEDPPLREHG